MPPSTSTSTSSPTSSPPSQPSRTSTQPSSSPFDAQLPVSEMRFASPKTLHMVDITYPESYMRTPLPLLPFNAPKWLLGYGRSVGECIVEFDEDDEADIVRESIEPREENESIKRDGDTWGDGKREWVGCAGSRKRRFNSEPDDDIISIHPAQKLKRS